VTPDLEPGAYWYKDGAYLARATLDGDFGYDDDDIGEISFWTRDSLNGAQMITTSTFSADVPIKNLGASGDLLHGQPSGPGTETGDNYKETERDGTLSSGSNWKPFSGSSGYKSYDKAFNNHANVVEVVWHHGDLPGRWYAYLKSVIANCPDTTYIYKFGAVSNRFTDSSDKGYE
jgi:hypothetical protein